MFCPKCGRPTEDGQLLCPDCLAAQNAAPQQPVYTPPVQETPVYTPPVQETPVYTPPVQETPVYTPPVQETPVYNAPVQPAPQESFNLNFAGGADPQPVKAPKVKKLLFGKIPAGAAIGGGIAILAAIALVVGFIFFDLGAVISNFFASTFQKPEAYKDTVESSALTSEDSNSEIALVKRGVTSVYGAFIEAMGKTNASSMNLSVRAELGTELTKLLENAMAAQGGGEEVAAITEVLKALQKAEITLNTATDNDLSSAELGVKLNGQTLAAARLIIDTLGGKLYAGLTEPAGLNGQYICADFDLEELAMQAGVTMPDEKTLAAMSALAQRLPSEEEFASMLDAFVLAAMSQITEVEKSSEKMEAGDITQSFTVLTYDISEKTAMDAVKAVLEEASTNATFKKFVEAICATASEVGGMQMSADDLFAQLDAAQESLTEGGYEPSTETVISIQTYVDAKGDIQGRTFDLEEAVGEKTEITYVTTTSGNKQGFLLEVKGEMGTMAKLEGSGTHKDNATNGSYTLKIMDQEAAILELQNFNAITMTGTIKLMPGSALVDSMEQSIPVAGLIDLSKLALELTLGEGSFDLAATMNSKLLVSVGMTLTAGSASGSINIPSDVVNIEDSAAMQAWVQKFAEGEEVIMNQLKKVGLDKLLEMVMAGTSMREDIVAQPGWETEDFEEEEPFGTGTVTEETINAVINPDGTITYTYPDGTSSTVAGVTVNPDGSYSVEGSSGIISAIPSDGTISFDTLIGQAS